MPHARTDANHRAVVEALRAAGYHVESTSWAGRHSPGFPDALVIYRGRMIPLEIKDGTKPPSERKLTRAEIKKAEEWEREGMPIYMVLSAEEALEVLTKEAGSGDE